MNGRSSLWFFCSSVLMLFIWATFSYTFQLGIENISADIFKILHLDPAISYRIGLITNQTGVDQNGNRTVDILQQKGWRILYILAPEHGFDGMQPAGKPISNAVDQKTGIPIVSIYGRGGDHTIAGKQIDPLTMRQLDLLVYDIQDAGMRHYTYISTLLCALEAAAEHGKPIIVLDRPNLLGSHIEGPLVDPYPQLKSFISIAPIPLRYGMTVGEMARYFNKYIVRKAAKLHVVPMKDYTRTMSAPFLRFLSPNLASLASVYGYSFLGILGEIEPFNIGVGTPYAFQTIMLPDSLHFPSYEWTKVKVLLNKYGIHATYHSGTKNRQLYSGLKLQISDGKNIDSFALLLDLLQFFKQAGVRFSYSATFDKAIGTSKVRDFCTGTCSQQELRQFINAGLERFFAQTSTILLYEPLPEIKKLF